MINRSATGRTLRASCVLLCLGLCFWFGGCRRDEPSAASFAALAEVEEAFVGSESEGAETVELAVLMGELQRHSMKLGYAVAGRNQPLAEFYLHEIEEVQEDLMAIGEHEGMPIGSTTRIILAPTLEALEATLGQGNWDRDWQRYEAVIQACNRCHQATEHGFVEILPAQGEPPYNQRFAAPADP